MVKLLILWLHGTICAGLVWPFDNCVLESRVNFVLGEWILLN